MNKHRHQHKTHTNTNTRQRGSIINIISTAITCRGHRLCNKTRVGTNNRARTPTATGACIRFARAFRDEALLSVSCLHIHSWCWSRWRERERKKNGTFPHITQKICHPSNNYLFFIFLARFLTTIVNGLK